MSAEKFPNIVYRISVSPSSAGLNVHVCKMPCKIGGKTVMTANQRRIALEKFGKVNTFAETKQHVILSCWVLTEEEVAQKVKEMERKVAAHLEEIRQSVVQRLAGLKEPQVFKNTEWDFESRSVKESK